MEVDSDCSFTFDKKVQTREQGNNSFFHSVSFKKNSNTGQTRVPQFQNRFAKFHQFEKIALFANLERAMPPENRMGLSKCQSLLVMAPVQPLHLQPSCTVASQLWNFLRRGVSHSGNFCERNAMSANVWLLWNCCVGLTPSHKKKTNAHLHEVLQDTLRK